MVDYEEVRIVKHFQKNPNDPIETLPYIDLKNDGSISVSAATRKGSAIGEILLKMQGKPGISLTVDRSVGSTQTYSSLVLGAYPPGFGGGRLPGGNLVLNDSGGLTRFEMRAHLGTLTMSYHSSPPYTALTLDSNDGFILVKDKSNNPAFGLYSEGFIWHENKTNQNKPVAFFTVGKHKNEAPQGGKKAGLAVIRNTEGDDAITLDGVNGDIILANADCAEEFDISPSELSQVEPGTVMVIVDEGALRVSSKSYDKRVAGVISGGGNLKPGIVLDKKKSQNPRVPLATLGKVFCKVDADQSSIKVGDMLTTSNTLGHAMKATNRSRSFGAVIGKALGPLKEGVGLIPILIALQ
jgi:hypothetical protein